MKIEVAENERKSGTTNDTISFPGLDSCLGITVRDGSSLHAVHLVQPYDGESVGTYKGLLDGICEAYESAIEEQKSMHFSFNPDVNSSVPRDSALYDDNGAEVRENGNKIDSLSELDAHIADLRSLAGADVLSPAQKEQAIRCIELLGTLKNKEHSYFFGPINNGQRSALDLQGGWSEIRRKRREGDIAESNKFNDVTITM